MAEKHTILRGKVHVYKRPESPIWQCSAYLAGKNRRMSTKEDSLAKAKDFAEDWYLELRGKDGRWKIKNEHTRRHPATRSEEEYVIMTNGERNAKYVADHSARLRNHLILCLGNRGLSEIRPGLVQECRIHRMNAGDRFKAPSRTATLHEIVTLR